MSTWTTNKTWAYKETLSSSDMNTYVRDNNNATDAHPNGVYVKTSGAKIRLGNDLELVFNNLGGSESATIKQDTSNDVLLNNTDGLFHFNTGGSNVVAVFESTDSTAGIAFADNITTTRTYVRIQALGDDLQFAAGNTNYGRITSSGVWEVYDSTLNDKLTSQHDGSNALIGTNAGSLYFIPSGNVLVGDGSSNFASLAVYSGTTNFGIKQISSDAGSYLDFQDNTTSAPQTVYVGALGDYLQLEGGKVQIKTTTATTGQVNMESSTTVGGLYISASSSVDSSASVPFGVPHAEYHRASSTSYSLLKLGNQTGAMYMAGNNDSLRFYNYAEELLWKFDETDGAFLYDSNSNSRYLNMYVDTNVHIEPASGNVHIGGGARLRIYNSSGGSNYLDHWHDGSNGYIASANGALVFVNSGGSNRIHFNSGAEVRYYDASNTDYFSIVHGINITLSSSADSITISSASDLILDTDEELTILSDTGVYFNDASSHYQFDMTTGSLVLNDLTNTGGTTGDGYITLNSGGTTRYIRLQATP